MPTGRFGIIAYAQIASDLVTDEVVVTASRFEEKQSDQPIGVTVITAKADRRQQRPHALRTF